MHVLSSVGCMVTCSSKVAKLTNEDELVALQVEAQMGFDSLQSDNFAGIQGANFFGKDGHLQTNLPAHAITSLGRTTSWAGSSNQVSPVTPSLSETPYAPSDSSPHKLAEASPVKLKDLPAPEPPRKRAVNVVSLRTTTRASLLRVLDKEKVVVQEILVKAVHELKAARTHRGKSCLTSSLTIWRRCVPLLWRGWVRGWSIRSHQQSTTSKKMFRSGRWLSATTRLLPRRSVH